MTSRRGSEPRTGSAGIRGSGKLKRFLRRRQRSPLGPIAASVVAGASISGVYTMTRRTTKEILLEVCAGRERQNQSHDDPVEHGDAPPRFHSLRHQPTLRGRASKHEGRLPHPRIWPREVSEIATPAMTPKATSPSLCEEPRATTQSQRLPARRGSSDR